MIVPALGHISAALPEIFLALSALVLLVLGAFLGDKAVRPVATLALIALVVAFVLVFLGPDSTTVGFSGLFITGRFAVFLNALILIGSAISLIIALDYFRLQGTERFEFPILVLLATTGMMMMVTANDLIALFISLELQSLALYVMAAFERDSVRATEAGLKYFVLGALASGLLLYGCSLIYGFSGTTNFSHLAAVVSGGPVSIGLLLGIVFLVAGLAFKISAVPFHMWAPDVYEGAPTPVTAFFSASPKIAAFALFIRVMMGPFGHIAIEWRQIIILISLASMFLGAFAAINQRNIKRMMAYSSIGHMGYALIGLAAGSVEGVRGVLIYLAIYLPMTLGTFTVILLMRRKTGPTENIDDLAGLSQQHPLVALVMAIFMFSLAGVPPLAGFFGKFYVFMAAIDAHLYTLAILGVLSSVVGAYYYLRIVKVMYFDAASEPLAGPITRKMAAVLLCTGVFTLFFFANPAPLLNSAHAAALALLH